MQGLESSITPRISTHLLLDIGDLGLSQGLQVPGRLSEKLGPCWCSQGVSGKKRQGKKQLDHLLEYNGQGTNDESFFLQ